MYDAHEMFVYILSDEEYVNGELKALAEKYIVTAPNPEELSYFLDLVRDYVQERRDDGEYTELSEFYTSIVRTLFTEEEIKKANAELAELVKAFNDNLSKAEKLADKYGLGFGINPSYGMGGHYAAGGWNASSRSC